MTAQAKKVKVETNSKSIEKELSKYGISRTTTDVFHYGKYNYTNLKDAVAQAKRNPEQGKT